LGRKRKSLQGIRKDNKDEKHHAVLGREDKIIDQFNRSHSVLKAGIIVNV